MVPTSAFWRSSPTRSQTSFSTPSSSSHGGGRKKNYRAHWHNFVTNEHRFASLLAIDRIRRDADADIRRELDIQAAVVLLVPSESAYLEAEGEKEITAGERLLRVEETIRGLATHGKAASKKA